MDNYNVFIIGGQTKNRTYLSTTWRAAFNVIPDQVSIENFFYTRGFLLNHVYLKNVLEVIWEMTKNDVLINFLVFLYMRISSLLELG